MRSISFPPFHLDGILYWSRFISISCLFVFFFLLRQPIGVIDDDWSFWYFFFPHQIELLLFLWIVYIFASQFGHKTHNNGVFRMNETNGKNDTKCVSILKLRLKQIIDKLKWFYHSLFQLFKLILEKWKETKTFIGYFMEMSVIWLLINILSSA